jgi:tellurite resistance protein TerC
VDAGGEDAPKGCLAKRIGIAIVGGSVTLIGIALIVLPGPAIVVIPIGLSILGTQFEWPRRYLRKARDLATRVKEKASARRSSRSPT